MRQLILLLIFLGGLILDSSAQTEWNVIQPVTSSTLKLQSPRIAVSPNGHLALAFMGHDAVTSSSGGFGTYIHKNRRSDVFVSFADDLHSAWSDPVQLSDTRLLNAEIDIATDGMDNFQVSWASGDAMSGFRFHSSKLGYGETTATYETILQPLANPNQGYLYLRTAVVGSNLLISANGYRHENLKLVTRGFAASKPDGLASLMDITSSELPPTSSTFCTNAASSGFATDGMGRVIIPCWITHASASGTYSALKNIRLMMSDNNGQTWTHNDSVTTHPVVANSMALETDKAGVWVLVWTEANGGIRYGKCYIQRSIDNGISWSPPQIIPDSGYGSDPVIATDNAGRWMIYFSGQFSTSKKIIWSDDNGATWPGSLSFVGNQLPFQANDIMYLGNGYWGMTGSNYTYFPDTGSIYLATTRWAPSAISDWELY